MVSALVGAALGFLVCNLGIRRCWSWWKMAGWVVALDLVAMMLSAVGAGE